MTGTGPYANSSSWTAMAIETVRGTPAAAPTYWIPVKTPKITPTITEVNDDGLRGSAVAVYDQIPTVRHDEYTFTCAAYVDTLPALMRALLGSTDTITGTTPTFTHTISLLNNDPTDGNQPPSYTFFDYDGYTLRTLPGGQIDEVSFKFTATGLVEVTVKVFAMPYTAGGAVPATAFTAVEAAPAWSCTTSLNSVSTTPIVDGSLSFKRNVKPIHILGQQAPFRLWAGELDSSGQLTVINQNDAEQSLYLNGTAFPLALTFNPPTSTGDSFKFTMSHVKAKAASQDRGSDGLIVTVLDLLPLPNATDAGSGGVAPVQFVAVTSQATTY